MVISMAPQMKFILEFGYCHLIKNLKTKPSKKDSPHLELYFKRYCILKLDQNSIFISIFFPQKKKQAGSTPSQTDERARGSHPSAIHLAREQGRG